MGYEIDGIEQIEYPELQEIVNRKEKEPILIDVRELEEYENGHIPSIPLIPMNSIPTVLEELDKEKEYVFVCRSGNRSHHVALFLKQNGFEKVSNYAGGMLGWEGELEVGVTNVVKDVKEIYK